MGRRRRRFAMVGAGLVVAGVTVSLIAFDAGDSYCGRVAWDAYRGAPCADRIQLYTVLTAGLIGSGLVALLTALRWSAVAVLAVVALAFGAVALNRLLEPNDDPRYCGSVLNRHRTYEAEHAAACDEQLASRRRAAAIAGGAAAASSAHAVLVAVRRPPPRLSGAKGTQRARPTAAMF